MALRINHFSRPKANFFYLLGNCPPCSKKSLQLCQCKRNKKECDCATPDWHCTESCGRPLGCGHHLCDLVCHEGPCPPCPLSQLRSCPCGKSRHQLPCTEATPTCFDTCGKVLACGKTFIHDTPWHTTISLFDYGIAELVILK